MTPEEYEEVGRAMAEIGEFENLDNLLRLADFLGWNLTTRIGLSELWREARRSNCLSLRP